MAGSMLGSSYTLLIPSAGGGWLSQHAAMWGFMRSLEGREYTELKDSIPDGLLRMWVSVYSFCTVCCRGILHILVRGHRDPLRTASSDTIILKVRPS